MLEKAINAVDTVQDPGEVPLVIHSKLSGPIGELTFLQRSLLFAELAMISYNDEDEARRAGQIIGLPDVTFYNHDGSQAYRFRNDYDCVIACRGTEPNEWNDIRADANAASVLAETAGKVHRGFKTEVRVVETQEKGRWWRIYVGNFATRIEARDAAPLLKKKLRTDWANPTRF